MVATNALVLNDQAINMHNAGFKFIAPDQIHDDVIKWKHFPRYWPFVRGIHPFPVNSPHKGQWRRALMFLLICVWINGWVNNREAGDLRRYLAHYDVSVMSYKFMTFATTMSRKYNYVLEYDPAIYGFNYENTNVTFRFIDSIDYL